MPLQTSCFYQISRVSAPAGSSSASVGGVLGSGLLTQRGQGQGQYCGTCISSQFSYSPCWDSLTYFDWFLVLLLLQNTLCRIDQITLFNVSLCLFVSIFQYRYIGEKSSLIKFQTELSGVELIGHVLTSIFQFRYPQTLADIFHFKTFIGFLYIKTSP